MKHDQLRAIAHNLADSFADGNGFLVGYYSMDVFGEAAQSDGGFVDIDFLTGTFSGGPISASLARAIELYRDALPEFCAKHGAVVSDFVQLSVRFAGEKPSTRGFEVTVADGAGRRTTTEYEGWSSRRSKILDSEGRVRPRPPQRS